MEYLIHGWNAFKFLVTPDELNNILKSFHLVIYNAHVPMNYVQTDLKKYIGKYRKLYDLVISGEKINWEKHYTLFDTKAITSDLKRCAYGHFHTYQGETYKRSDFSEPLVCLTPNALFIYVDEKSKLHLSSNASYLRYPQYCIGTEITYPKNIQYKIGNDYEPLKSTTQLAAFNDYEVLRKSIKGITKALVLKTDSDKRRTCVNISVQAKADLKNSYIFGKLID